jgi:hypothetical protein
LKKKNQKTFSVGSEAAAAPNQFEKVFCFFSSEKKCFLSFYSFVTIEILSGQTLSEHSVGRAGSRRAQHAFA